MGQKKKRHPRLEDLIPDKERREEIVRRMYNREPIVGEDGIFTDLLQALVNASLEGEMDHHLDKEKDDENGSTNRRNGHNKKTVDSRVGPIDVSTPRDRDGSYDPQMVKKWERELSSGMDEVILSLYARGQSVNDVQNQLRELYGVEVSSGVISSVTERIMPEITQWQQRPLDPCYPVVFLDAIHYKVREEGKVTTKAIYTVYGVNVEGSRDVLGLYLLESEGARQWSLILEDLQNRGVEDVFIFCIDGLTGFRDTIEAVFPQAQVQRCIVHMVRTSTRLVSHKDIKAVSSSLRTIYSASDIQQAEMALESFKAKWDKKYPEISKKWEESWDELMGFMDFGSNVRRLIYTTNPVEALHRTMRKVTKTKGAWSNEKALIKQLYLSLKVNKKSWNKKVFNWNPIQRELVKHYGERYEKHI
jgi:transposase-like protein